MRNKIPADYKGTFRFSDLWESYQKVLPDEQHQACAKRETAALKAPSDSRSMAFAARTTARTLPAFS